MSQLSFWLDVFQASSYILNLWITVIDICQSLNWNKAKQKTKLQTLRTLLFLQGYLKPQAEGREQSPQVINCMPSCNTLYFYLMYMNILLACVHMSHVNAWYGWRPGKSLRSQETGIMQSRLLWAIMWALGAEPISFAWSANLNC